MLMMAQSILLGYALQQKELWHPIGLLFMILQSLNVCDLVRKRTLQFIRKGVQSVKALSKQLGYRSFIRNGCMTYRCGLQRRPSEV